MAPLEPKPPDPCPLCPPFFPCSHGQIPHFLKVTDTGLVLVQALILGSVPENVCFHGALGVQMLKYGNFKPLRVRYSWFWSIMHQSRSVIFNIDFELGASSASIVARPNHLQHTTTTLHRCEGYMYDFLPSSTLQPLDLGEYGKSFLDFLMAQPPKA
ncbi:hypothetical protein Cgig2_027249 [Carnegiea gigantea]|uniref:Uncharacterized protein n=1 Tax=Carnegiea gigantea TaxID=171969 RepID=A0A9Q1K235_9CARY|nr:hypothetical protein Cgig2_027249 [Carnegiea gigantea]